MVKTEKSFIKRLKEAFDGLTECEEVEVKDSYHLSGKRIRVTNRDYPLQLNLGPKGKALHLYPEPIFSEEGVEETTYKFYIIFDPDCYYSEISGFIRLKEGETLTLGRSDPLQQAYFSIPKYVATRHLSICHLNGGVELKNHATDLGSCVAPLLKDKKVNRIINNRTLKLQRLKKIYGGPVKLLPQEEALSLIRDVNQLMEREPHRPPNDRGQPGGVVEISKKRPSVIIVGDLHAKVDNLLVILSQNGFLEALEDGSAVLVILGDAVHPEEPGQYDQMESSMLMMDLIFSLKIRFPKQLYYLRGNHDSFNDDFAKGGIPQGVVWAKTLKKSRGKEYLKEMERYYNSLPYLAYCESVIISHAAPPTSTVTREELVNIEHGSKLCTELNRTRLYSSSRATGYSKRDVVRLRQLLGVAETTPLVVGHTPCSDNDTLWLDIGEIENHHVVFSSGNEWVGVMAKIGEGIYPFRYHVEPLTEVINRL